MTANKVSPFLLLMFLGFSSGIPPQPQHQAYETTNGPTNIKQHPYLVSIHFEDKFACTGALLNWDWVLTAASCVKGYTADQITVRVGSNFVEKGGHMHRAIGLYINGESSVVGLENNAALIRLDTHVTYGPNTLPARLADENALVDQTVIFAGWATDKHGQATGSMQKGSMKVISYNECRDKLGITDEELICTKHTDGYIPCWGDFGGPLVNQWNAVVGIYSWSPSCSSPISVFMDAVKLKNWIQENSCCTR